LRSDLCVLALLLSSGVVLADEVRLSNGESVTGQVVKMAGGTLTVKSETMGTVNIPWAKVTGLMSETSLVVVFPDNHWATGRVRTVDERLVVADADGEESLPLKEVKALRNSVEQLAYERLLSPSWSDLWTGYFDFGLSLARGNAETTTFTTAFVSTRTTNTDKARVYFNQIFSRATIEETSKTTAKAVRGGWSYNKSLTSRMFVNLFNDYEFDQFQNLDLRFVLGSGLGYNMVKNNRTKLDLVGGAAYNRESFATPLVRNSAEAFWGDDFSHKLNANSSLNQSFRLFHNLTNTGEYRMNFDLGAATSINKWLALQATISDRYLSNPVPGRQNNDILFTAGIRVSFAR
jgi:putative salt-induced outer membrane protein YdiY